MGSTGYVTRRVPHVIFGRITGVAVAIVGVASTFTGADVAVVNHVAFVRRNYYPVVISSEGPDQRIHVVFNPSRQVAPDGFWYGSNGGVKSKLGSTFRRWLKTRENARPSRLRLLSSTSWRALLERFCRRVTTSPKKRRWLM